MKNFTKQNFKTNPLWIRLLIMTFMLLAGAGNAWAVDYYITGNVIGNWDEGADKRLKMTAHETNIVKAVVYLTGDFKVVNGATGWTENYNQPASGTGTTLTGGKNNNFNLQLNSGYSAPITIYYNYSTKYVWAAATACTSCCGSDIFRVAGSSNLCGSNWNGNDDNNKMICSNDIFSKSYDITANTSYTFKIVKNNSTWINTIYSNASITNKIALKTTGSDNNVTLSSNPTSNGKLTIYYDPNNGIYATFEKSCIAVTKPTISITNPTKCGDDPVAAGKITINEYNPEKYNYTLKNGDTVKDIVYDDGYAITEEGSYTVTADLKSGTSCGAVTSESKSASIEDKTPTIGDFKITGDTEICSGTSTNLECTNVNGGTYLWNTGATTRSINTGNLTDDTNYSVTVTKVNGTCPATKTANIAITVNARPSAPNLSNPEAICEGTTFILPEKDANKKTITWVGVDNRTLTGLAVDTHEYTAKIVENGCESSTVTYTITVKEQLAKPTLSVTNVIQCGSNYTAGKIVISNHNPNNTYILKKDGNPINKAYNDGYSVSENEIGTYTVEVSKDGACGATSDDVNIEVINNTPTVTPFEITKQANVCMGNPVTLSYDGTAQSGTISYAWYEGDSEVVIGTESTLTIQQANNASYKLVVTVTSNDCPASDKATTTVEPKAVPSAPTFDEYEMDACVDQQFTLPKPNNLKYEEEPLWTVEGLATTASQTISEAGIYTYTAYKNDGCPSQGTEFTVRVNPLPTINIGDDVTAVLYEDVVLTATGTNIANVIWTADNNATITRDATDPKKAVLTYNQAREVTVTAKAISAAGCESAEVSKKVTFGEEDCTPDASDDIQITFIHPNDKGKNCQYWGLGTLTYYIGSTKKTHNFGNSTTAGAEGNLTISNLTVDKITKVRLDAAYDYGKCTAYATIMDLEKGYHYTLTLSDAQQTSEQAQKSVTLSKVSLTNDPPITAPAVKMVSAEYDEVNDKIVAKGAVYKTGCGTTFWGFQYSTDGQTWGTAETDYIRPNSGNSLTKAGEFEYSFAIPNAGGGDIYYIRAYALNNYNKDNYSLNSAVFSETKIPVEIPSSTIESATILLVDSEGNESTDSEVCPQSTVYLKVSYVGGDFKDYEAADNFPGTNLELVNHDKVNNYAIFSYTATSTGVANITISNENTSVTPETGVNIAVKEVAVATPPTIYLEKNTICETQTTNVVVNSPIVGLSYSLKNGSVGDPVTYESGDLKFPVSKEGSYTVQVQETVCGTTAISAPVDLRVITSDVKITLTTDVNTITPWQPLTLTVKAPSGYDYDLQGLDGTVYTKSGDVYTIKFPRPDSWRVGNSESNSEPKTFTAGIKAGEEPSCSTTTKEIQLVDTVEDCLAVGN